MLCNSLATLKFYYTFEKYVLELEVIFKIAFQNFRHFNVEKKLPKFQLNPLFMYFILSSLRGDYGGIKGVRKRGEWNMAAN